MATSDKLTYLNETKSKIKNAINLTGANITNETFRQYPQKLYEKYLDILKNGTSALFANMPRVSDSGTELTLNDTANLPMSVELSASESTQETTSGKNKLKYDNILPISVTKNDVTVSIDKNGVITINGTSTASYIYFGLVNGGDGLNANTATDTSIVYLDLDETKTYTYSCRKISGTAPTGWHISTKTMVSGSAQWKEPSVDNSLQLSNCSGLTQVYIAITNNQTFDNFKFTLQIEEGTTATEYEPYTGAIASPNPDYPQEINVVTGENSVQIATVLPSEYQQVEYIESTGTQYIDTDLIPTGNTGFSIDFNTSNSLGTQKMGSILGNRTSYNSKALQLTTFSETDNPVTVGGHLLYGSGDIKNIRHSAYIVPNTRQNISFINGIFINGNGETENITLQTFTGTNNLILFGLWQNDGPRELSKTRLYSCKIYNTTTIIRNFIPCYRKNDSEIGLYDTVNNIFYTNQGTGTFEKGANVQGYIHDVYNLSLGNLELAKIGDYEDKIFNNVKSNPLYDVNLVEGGWYKYKAINKITLNGSENWATATVSSSTKTNRFSFDLVKLYPTQKANGAYGISMNNSFKQRIGGSHTDTEYLMLQAGSVTGLFINVLISRLSSNDLTGLKTWLASNNVIVYYVLDAPINEQITDTTLISQLEELKNATSYDEQTNISQTNYNRPFVISASAIKNSME